MRASIEQKMTVALVLSLGGCQPPPAEVTQDDGASSEGPPPTSTSVDGTASAPTGDATAGTASGGTSGATGTGATEASSESGADGSSTGVPTDEPLGPFGRPTAVTELNSAGDEDDPSLTGDMLEIYFNSDRDGGDGDVFVATRATVDAAWETPVAVDVINTGSNETFPEVSADGLVLLVASDRVSSGDLDVYYSYRAARDQDWSAPLPLAGAATDDVTDWGATLTPDLGRVLLCREDDRTQSDIWVAPANLDAWTVGTPVRIDELATDVAECSSTLSPSEREIFFETTRPAGGSWSLWTATREDPEGPWDDPVAVEGLDVGDDEVDPWLSPDRRTLWFAGGTEDAYDLYVATRR